MSSAITSEPVGDHRSADGAPGAARPCVACAAPLDDGQRYCLECGEATAAAAERMDWIPDARADRRQVAPEGAPPAPATAPEAHRPSSSAPRPTTDARDARPQSESRYLLYGAAGAAALLLTAIAAGFVGARIDGGDAPAAPVVVQAGLAAPSGATTAAETFTSNWPSGVDGWTIVLVEAPKASTTPAAAADLKAKAAGKGLEAGVLDSDDHSSLPAGNYVVYSGVYKSKKAAKKDLSKATDAGYPDAQVAEVSSGGDSGAGSSETVDRSELKKLDELPPEEAAKERLKLPDETSLPGEAPPTDDKKPGGDSEEVTIGSLGAYFGVNDRSGEMEVAGFDVNSLGELHCVWPSQAGRWTIGRALKLAPGTAAGWRFPGPASELPDVDENRPGVTFCQVDEQSVSAVLAFRGRYVTADAARRALRRDAELKSFGGHVFRVNPIQPVAPVAPAP